MMATYESARVAARRLAELLRSLDDLPLVSERYFNSGVQARAADNAPVGKADYVRLEDRSVWFQPIWYINVYNDENLGQIGVPTKERANLDKYRSPGVKYRLIVRMK